MANDGLYKRGQIWWCRYVDASGRTRRRSTRTRDKTVARQRKRAFELERPAHRASHGTLGGALTHLLDVVYAGRSPDTVASYRQKARHLVRLLGAETPVSEIDRARCHEYRATRLREGAHPHSVYKEAVVLRLALREQGIDGVVPRFRAEYKPRERYLTLEQFRAVMDQLPPKRRLWFKLACLLGARDRELARLRWEDFRTERVLLPDGTEAERGWLRVRGTKTRKADRVVPVHAALMPDLLAARQASGPILEPWTNRRRDVTAAWWRVVGYTPPPSWQRGGRDKSGRSRSIKGAPRISPNDLRRTFVSWLKQAGVDSLAVAQIAGTGVRMVESVYGQLTQDVFRAAVDRLPAPTDGAPSDDSQERECARSVPDRRPRKAT